MTLQQYEKLAEDLHLNNEEPMPEKNYDFFTKLRPNVDLEVYKSMICCKEHFNLK
jgi:hypothetical protein